MFRVRPSSNAGALTCGARKGCERLLPGSCLARRRVPHVNVHAPSAPAGPHSRCNAGGRCARGPLTAGRVNGWACPKAARQGSGHSEHACAWTDSTILQEPANMPSCYPSRHCQPGDRGGPWLTLAYMYVPCIIPMIPHECLSRPLQARGEPHRYRYRRQAIFSSPALLLVGALLAGFALCSNCLTVSPRFCRCIFSLPGCRRLLLCLALHAPTA